MTIYINAWLDCSNPHITINNSKTGKILTRFSAHEVEQLFSEGDISVAELESNDPSIQHELIKDLFLYKILNNLKQQLDALPKALRQRPAKPSLLPIIHQVTPPSITPFPVRHIQAVTN